ncbi:signal transduction histidine kinase [Actinophytocola oryzae]|uniref:histidine kinase n=2 Tax=Actinophytocola oryzae TaxID=502181 RepID=A0A4R7W3W6_9PSEU|nr:signal transduction histidine kinase [Actinophytocola oryzae]
MTRWRRSLARLGGHTPAGRDTVVAAVLAVLGLGRIPLALLLNDGRLPSAGWVVATATVLSTLDFAAIALRRRTPLPALGGAVAVVLAATALPAAYWLTGIGVVVCAYTVATLLPRGQAVVALSVAAAAHAVGGIVSTALGGHLHLVATFWAYDGGAPASVVLISAGTFALPGLVGLYVQTTRAYAAELAARVGRLEEERELRAEAAAAQERARIARELHDVAAHDLSAIVVQAGAADRLVERDPAQARDALRAIRTQGRRTLTAMRQLVGIMRAGDTDVASLSTVDGLVTASRDLGMTVTVEVTGTVAPLSPAADIAAYRLVQEGLTNARQHAPGAAVSIAVVYRAAGVSVTVRNGRAEAPGTGGGGHGLVGMRERIRHCGGELRVGPADGGGWEIAARLPLARQESA